MRRTACLLFFALGCPPPLTNTTGFNVDPDGVQLSGESSGPAPEPQGSSSTGGRESTGDPGTVDTTTDTPPQPDFGPVAPAGCAGKIDFLFVISSGLFDWGLPQMLEAVPGFYTTIADTFPDFDTHILVTDVDAGWRIDDCAYCTDDCDPAGEPPLCGAEIDACDTTLGAGVTFSTGEWAPNRRCDLAGGRRYITKDEPDPLAAFECIATSSAGTASVHAGEAMFKAFSPELSGPGGCNEGFLRDDALLVVTIFANGDTDSDGHLYTWKNKLLAAKYGDPDAFLVLVISGDDDIPDGVCPDTGGVNRLRQFADYVPHGMFGSMCAKSYVPFFTDAATAVLELCDGFIPQ
jgi:hypothetical protein